MKRRRRVHSLLLLVVVVSFIAGCTASTPPAPTTTTPVARRLDASPTTLPPSTTARQGTATAAPPITQELSQTLAPLQDRIVGTASNLACIDPQRCWMVTILDDGDGPLQLFVTADSGTSWGPRSLPAEFISRYAVLRLGPEGRGWLFTLEEPALYLTRDNAATWQRVALDAPLLALDGRFDILWAVAGRQFEPETQRLLRSNDNGLTWQPAAAQPPSGAQLYAIDGQRAFAIVDRADDDQLLYTSDGAQSWTTRTLPAHHPGLQLYLATLDADQLWLTARGQGGTRDQGAPGQLYHSSDGGQSWELRNDQGFILPVVPLSPDRLFAQGRGPLLRSDDGGVTWNRGLPVQEEWDFDVRVVTDLVFIDARHGWAYSWPSLFRTTDGGDTWEELPFPGKP